MEGSNRGSMNMERLLKTIQKEVIIGKRRFFSPERHQNKTKEKEREVTKSVSSSNVEWKEPSPRTCEVMKEIFSKLFTDVNELNLDLIEKTLTLCPPDEDILLIEDRDHYNLMHKAIIFDSVPLVTLLLNHGCETNGCKSVENCTVSKNKCSHEGLGALHLASFLGRIDIVTVLLQRGCDRNLSRRVYTSAVINDPKQQQPQLMNSSTFSRAIEIISKCSSREAIFYAVLGDHLDIVQTLLGDNHLQSGKPDPQYGYLVQLACRVGAYRCLHYLLDLYPDELNRKDGDGLPLLLMALNHELKFVHLLLDYKADIHLLDNFLEQGSNILHLLFQSLPMEVSQDIARLCQVTQMCLRSGADVNAQRQPFNRTPLHDLLSVLNIPLGFDPFWRDNESAEIVSRQQEHFDNALIRCVNLLLEHGSDVNIADSNGKYPLQTLLSNGNHTLRANMCLDNRTCAAVRDAMQKRNYGLENTISIAKLLIQAGCTTGPNISGSTSLRDLVEMMCSSYFGSDFWAWSHSLEILEVEPIFNGYAELIQMLLEYGVDPNKSPPSQLPPLLYLLSHIADSPYTDNYVVPMVTADALEKLIRILLHYGAKSETKIETTFGIKTLSCFDMLMPVLATLQAHQLNRSDKDLQVVRTLILPLVQYGCSSIVFQKILYDIPGASAHAPWCYCVPSHSFFYQFLQFGMSNLQFTTSPHYTDIFAILYNHTDHLTAQEVLAMISNSLLRSHEDECSCGSCDPLKVIIMKVLGRPRTLKQLSRLAIKAAMNNNVAERVHLLPLPKLLVNYVSDFSL